MLEISKINLNYTYILNQFFDKCSESVNRRIKLTALLALIALVMVFSYFRITRSTKKVELKNNQKVQILSNMPESALINSENSPIKPIKKQVGSVKVLNIETNSWIPAKIFKKHLCYTLVSEEGLEPREIGFMNIDWFRVKKDGKFGSERYGDEDSTNSNSYKELYEYAGKEHKISKIYIDVLRNQFKNVHNVKTESSEKIKGIGSILMQIAIEKAYLKMCDGRIFLKSSKSAIGFYYKLGFRSYSEEIKKLKMNSKLRKEKVEKSIQLH